MIVKEFNVTETNKTVVSIDEFNKKTTIDVRDWFKTKGMEAWQATKRGVKFTTDQASELVSAFEQVEDIIRKGAGK